jgi:hypothetical protein
VPVLAVAPGTVGEVAVPEVAVFGFAASLLVVSALTAGATFESCPATGGAHGGVDAQGEDRQAGTKQADRSERQKAVHCTVPFRRGESGLLPAEKD